jgi:DNA-binding transcriptional LysR family regulator
MKSMTRDHTFTRPSFRRPLPPLHALEIFATAARCGTFSRAAKELFVTQSAISRQIQQIEAHLGATLFVRHKNGLSLTPEGEALLPVIEDAFGRVARACDNLRNAAQLLTLRMPPTWATRRFLTLLPALSEALPDVDIRVTTYDAWKPSFEDNDVDAAIVLGSGDWRDVEMVRLTPERLTPVATPAIARTLTRPADLASVKLLHCHPIQAWPRWLDRAGLPPITGHNAATFDTLELALLAAEAGQGVALGDRDLVQDAITAGRLAAPFDLALDQGLAYYLIYPAHRGQLGKIRALRAFLAGVLGVEIEE